MYESIQYFSCSTFCSLCNVNIPPIYSKVCTSSTTFILDSAYITPHTSRLKNDNIFSQQFSQSQQPVNFHPSNGFAHTRNVSLVTTVRWECFKNLGLLNHGGLFLSPSPSVSSTHGTHSSTGWLFGPQKGLLSVQRYLLCIHPFICQ